GRNRTRRRAGRRRRLIFPSNARLASAPGRAINPAETRNGMSGVSPMRRILPLLAVLALAACASNGEEETYVEAPVEQLYGQATGAMKDGDYRRAASLYDEVER